MIRNSAHFAEIYLHKPEALSKLEPFKIKAFWANRSWHPVVKMMWHAEIDSNGEGLIKYPDGSQRTYEVDQPVRQSDKVS